MSDWNTMSGQPPVPPVPPTSAGSPKKKPNWPIIGLAVAVFVSALIIAAAISNGNTATTANPAPTVSTYSPTFSPTFSPDPAFGDGVPDPTQSSAPTRCVDKTIVMGASRNATTQLHAAEASLNVFDINATANHVEQAARSYDAVAVGVRDFPGLAGEYRAVASGLHRSAAALRKGQIGLANSYLVSALHRLNTAGAIIDSFKKGSLTPC